MKDVLYSFLFTVTVFAPIAVVYIDGVLDRAFVRVYRRWLRARRKGVRS